MIIIFIIIIILKSATLPKARMRSCVITAMVVLCWSSVRSECAEHGVGTEAPRCEAFLLDGAEAERVELAAGQVQASGARHQVELLEDCVVSAQSSRAAPARHKRARCVSAGQQ